MRADTRTDCGPLTAVLRAVSVDTSLLCCGRHGQIIVYVPTDVSVEGASSAGRLQCKNPSSDMSGRPLTTLHVLPTQRVLSFL